MIDADRVGHEALEDPGVIQQLQRAFGEEILTPEGRVDRKKLGQRVFQDPEALKTLNQIVREPILQRIERQKAEAEQDIVVVDAALIYEYGLEDTFDAVIVVTAPEEVLVDRFQRKTGYPRPIAERVVKNAQIPQEEKARRADFVIRNDGSLEDLRTQAQRVWQQILQRAQRILESPPSEDGEDLAR